MQSSHIMVIMIVMIVMIASVLRAWLTGGRARRRDAEDGEAVARDSVENTRLRDEVKQLKERIQVLERITVEKENSLERQIEALRDR